MAQPAAARPRSATFELAIQRVEREDREFINSKLEYGNAMAVPVSLRTNDYAKELFAILDRLENIKGQMTSATWYKAVRLRIEQVKEVVKKEIDSPDDNGRAPIHNAAFANDGDTFRKLLAHGANPYKAEPSSRNIVHAAIYGKSLNCINAALERDMRLARLGNRVGTTPLDYARSLQKKLGGYEEIITRLEKAVFQNQ